ncbi:CHAT domain-containing protein [Agromyces protaetiae]|uniref:CHAT domain-containing protein n=1 Tax=Agromyces protaetiae TaxID=2509455 RepID=A0A4P6F923_9MICO|nr:CHAT domain-containing protein [Agromyces protaetiae]QAY72075.1 CHAT domain-containing protein [Agromyces protaetiae]
MSASVGTRTPSAVRRRVSVERIARATDRLNKDHLLVANLRAVIEDLGRTRLVSVGAEQGLVDSLTAILARADLLVEQIASPSADRAQLVDALELELAAPRWEAARQSLVDLEAKRAAANDYITQLDQERATRRLPLNRFRAAVARATEFGLQIDEAEIRIATEGVRMMLASDADVLSGRWDTVAVALGRLTTLLQGVGLDNPKSFEDRTKAIEGRADEAAMIDERQDRRVELILISEAQVEKDVSYAVLVRRPRYARVQETNLHQHVKIYASDQALFRQTIDDIAAGAVRNIRSAADPPTRRAEPVLGPAAAVDGPEDIAGIPLEDIAKLPPDRRLELVGRRMYALLIPDAMQRLIAETDGFPLTITSNNPELPWELLHDGEEYLCLDRMFSRLPAGQTFPRRSRDTQRESTTSLRVLLIDSAPDDELPQAREEIAEIEQLFAVLRASIAQITVVRGEEITAERLTNEFGMPGGYDIIHYAGHAGYDRNNLDPSYLLLPGGDKFYAERVRRLLEGNPIVFLNACESSRAPSQGDVGTSGTVALAQGLASAFVYGGARACVGSLWPVFDDTARMFASEFYRSLIGEGRRVGEALRSARLKSKEAQSDRITWASYALYGDPAFKLKGGIGPSITTTT